MNLVPILVLLKEKRNSKFFTKFPYLHKVQKVAHKTRKAQPNPPNGEIRPARRPVETLHPEKRCRDVACNVSFGVPPQAAVSPTF